MSLTRVSPALFQVSNNITSVTVGGSANTVSLTFDSNGVITGASNNALSVANTQITGLIEAAQIGSANATLVTSGTLPAARLPAGSVLQVVMGTYAIDTSTTSASFVTTGLSASITPRSTSSKILVLYTGTYFVTVSSKGVRIQITRAATSIYAPSNYNLYSSAVILAQQTLSYLDSPVTTSATTYAINFSTPDGSTVRAQYDNNQSTIVLMEIQG